MCYIEFTNWALNTIRSQIYWVSDNKITQPQYILVMKVFSANYQLSENQLFSGAYQITATAVSFLGIKYTDTLMKFRDVTTGTFLVQPLRRRGRICPPPSSQLERVEFALVQITALREIYQILWLTVLSQSASIDYTIHII